MLLFLPRTERNISDACAGVVHIRCVLFELGHCPQVKKINVLARGYNDECPGLVIITDIKEGVKKTIR